MTFNSIKCLFKIVLIAQSMVVLKLAYAEGDFNKQFDAGMEMAKQLQGTPMAALQSFKPEETIANYNAHPKEERYQENESDIKQDAVTKAQNDDTGKSIQSSIAGRPQFPDIKPGSPEIEQIAKRGDDLLPIITGDFEGCTKQTSCTTTYTQKTCEETPASSYHYCKRTLQIEMKPKQVVTHYPFRVNIGRCREYIGERMDAVTGSIVFHQPESCDRPRLDGRLPGHLACSSLSSRVVNSVDGLDGFDGPSCGNNRTIGVHITRRSAIRSAQIDIDVASTVNVPEPQDRWVDECVSLKQSPLCVLQEERCIAPKSTHVIDGVPVTRDCWEYESKYLCRPSGEVKTCQPLRDQGCEQINSVCQLKTDTGCQSYLQTFQCPEKKCSEGSMICNGETYCLTSECVKQQKTADPDFQKAVSVLAALQDAAKNMANNAVFAGKAKSCDNTILGLANCCRNEGWLIDDIKLIDCRPEEKQLGKDKENGLTVYLGEFCETDVVGLCLKHRKAYCVFPSKLARIVQEQGRDRQLHVSFGNSEHPNCRGLSLEEFQRLDFSKIDFSEFYTEIASRTKIEDGGKINQRVEEKMREWSEGHKPHG